MKKDTISRRQFLKGAAASMAGAALMGSVIPVRAEGEAKTLPSGKASYELYQTELLIIGTGSGATWAAQRAIERGKEIMMVDKGPFRHSGASAMSWDALMIWFDYAGYRNDGWMLINGDLSAKAYNYLGAESFDPYVESINHGQTLVHRDENGAVKMSDLPKTTYSSFYRREMDELNESHYIEIMDQTMITDLLVVGGRCLGAIGLHMPTGTMRVIRADATIIAAGGGTQIHGWLSVGYRGINSTDNTGDVDMAAFRKGLTIGEAEFAQYDFNSIIFKDLAHTFGCGIGADAGELELLYDANHERIFSDEEIESGVVNGNLGMCQRIARIVFEEGRGTANDGVYVTYTEDSYNTVRYPIMRNVAFYQQNGYDPIGNFTEVAAEMFEHGGTTVIDENMMTELEGLFNVRGAGACGENGGPHCMHNRLYGHYTGSCAADYLDKAEPLPAGALDLSSVEAEFERLTELRTRKVENGLRPYEIRRKIQAAGYRGFTIYRSTQMMEEAIAELERIRKEDMPRQMLADDSTTFNVDWKTAIENINLLDLAEVSIRASLLREETRGAYLRPEFPEKDDVNWNCMLACHLEDGKMVFEKRPYPAL